MMYVAATNVVEVILGWGCLAVAVLGCAYLIVASIVVLRWRRGSSDAGHAPTAVSILIPLCGKEPCLERRVEALCGQLYDAPVQIIWGVQDPGDPAIVMVRRAIARFPERDTLLNIDACIRGRNRKMTNLINMMKHARHDTIVTLDSDIHVAPDYLAAVVGTLQEAPGGVVTSLYHGTSAAGIWSRLAALGIDLHFLPSVCVALAFGLAQPCFGSTMAMRRETLERIGGFDAFADELFDDNAIGEAVRQSGEEVRVLPMMVTHVCREASPRELAETQLRYARTVRAIDPAGNAGSVITHPFPVALVALAFGWRSASDIALLAIICRLILCLCVERRFGVARHSYWLLPLRDCISFAAYFVSFLGSTVVWRGRRYRLLRGGGCELEESDGIPWLSLARVTRRLRRWNRASS